MAITKIEDKDFYEKLSIKEFIPIIRSKEKIGKISYLDFVFPEGIEDWGDIPKGSWPPDPKDFEKAPEITLEVKLKDIVIKDNHGLSFSNFNKPDLSKFGIDKDAMIISMAISEGKQSVEKELLNYIKELASKNEPLIITKKEKFLSNLYSIFGKKYDPVVKIKGQQDLIRRLVAESHLVAIKTRRGSANFVIVGAALAILLESESNSFVSANDNKIHNSYGLIYKGSIAGMRIFLNPLQKWDDNSVIMGRKGETEPGVWLVYHKDQLKIISNKTKKTLNFRPKYTLMDIGKKSHVGYRKINFDYNPDI